MRNVGTMKRLVAALALIAVALLGGASAAGAEGSSWYAETPPVVK